MAITLEDVKQAVEQLKEEGIEKPSAGKVRALMGTGGMGTIQKYLKELREDEVVEEATDTEQQQIQPVAVDPAMVTEHVKTIIEHVATATRSAYLQQLIDLDAKAAGLEVELAETKQNYDELATDFEEANTEYEESSAEMVAVEKAQLEKIQKQDKQIGELEAALEAAQAKAQVEIDAIKQAHEKEILGLQAANKQLETVIESITKRIGVAPAVKGGEPE